MGVEPKLGGKFHLKLNIRKETDSEKVARANDEKNFEKRVKKGLEIVKKEAKKREDFWGDGKINMR